MPRSVQQVLEQTFEGQSFSGILRLLVEVARPFRRASLIVLSISLGGAVVDALGAALFVPLMQLLSQAPPSSFDGFGPLARVSARVLDSLSGQNQFLLLGLAFLGTALLRAGFRYWSNLSLARFTVKAAEGLRGKMLAAYLGADYKFFLDRRQGRLLDDLVQQPQAGARSLGLALEMARDLLTLLMVLLVLFALSWQATLVVMGGGAVLVLLMEQLRLRSLVVGKDEMVNQRGISSLTSETISGIRQVKLFGAEQRISDQLSDLSQERIRVGIMSARIREIPPSVAMVAVGVVLGAALAGLSLTSEGFAARTLPLLAAFALVAMRLLPVLATMSTRRLQLFRQAISLRYVVSVLNFLSPDERQATGQGTLFTKLNREVRFENVDFAYSPSPYSSSVPSRPKWGDPEIQLTQDGQGENGPSASQTVEVLESLNVVFGRGSRTGIVGPSGAGKSTIADLIVRLFEPQSGRILADGVDLRDLNLRSWRARVGFVSQDTFLFGGTVRENIAFAEPEATQERIEHAARIANAHDFITGLPAGYDTVVGDRGMKLSGGQRQRIAIARAVLPDPPILVFDEATSSLDVFAEQVVQAGIGSASEGRTVIIIAHRLSTVANCDWIYVIDRGQAVEQGTHADLMEADGYYARSFRASGYDGRNAPDGEPVLDPALGSDAVAG